MQNEELRETQRELEEIRNRYRNLYDYAPVGYFTLNRNGRVDEVNLSGAAMVGLTQDELINQKFSDFVVPESQADFASYQQNALASEGITSTETVLQKSGGLRFNAMLESSVLRNERGKPVQWRLTMTDITAEKHAEELLRESDSRMRMLLSQAPCIIWTADAELRMTFFQGTLPGNLEARHIEVIGRKMNEYLKPGEPNYETFIMSMRALNGESVSYDAEIGGRKFHAYVEPVRDASRNITGVIGVAVDVTAEKRAEAELKLHASLLDTASDAVFVRKMGRHLLRQ